MSWFGETVLISQMAKHHFVYFVNNSTQFYYDSFLFIIILSTFWCFKKYTKNSKIAYFLENYEILKDRIRKTNLIIGEFDCHWDSFATISCGLILNLGFGLSIALSTSFTCWSIKISLLFLIKKIFTSLRMKSSKLFTMYICFYNILEKDLSFTAKSPFLVS